ncbi:MULTISPECIES: DUF421 domain-containing protein [Pseudomonas]|jgi:uncharacterized membrane protein YcaP (DUF421 family)|uniref:DUF421 domain-containing protein n=5 Tax=Pseudomonas TaxID=286 RepID=A0AB37ZTR6_PSESX|nr:MULTISPECIES: YetF domain-containing protein [Pseudomonas]AKF53227.1 putative membrane protein [Pseudomonas syringae pv. syringae HS191]ALE00825.1 membrane protein [Pseudomonas syringae UMAF0158]ELQ15296.1 hypothetical protein A988_00510 [Pseudomonas syringae BRIP39023]KPB25019.1 Uncharacterized protein AC517_3322 [Pseudomonas syringae pv. syringae]KPY24918.1 putative membrane protein [Pseudomonas syringae pv. papulans]
MDAVLRAAAIYFVLMVLFRIAGRRSLTDLTTFDFVLLLIIGEATQQALLGDDFSVTNAILIISTLIAIDVGFSLAKRRSKRLAKFLDGGPTVIVEDGKPLTQRMREARISESDVMEAARTTQGIVEMKDIRYAIIERNGEISVIPFK